MALIPGWESLCRELNTVLLSDFGTYSLTVSFVTSQYKPTLSFEKCTLFKYKFGEFVCRISVSSMSPFYSRSVDLKFTVSVINSVLNSASAS